MPLPPRLLTVRPHAEKSGHTHGVDSCLVLGVLEREGRCGATLKPSGPGGTGDWTPRSWTHIGPDGVAYKDQEGAATRYHLLPPSKDGGPLLCMPADGLGWGRGIMQIDYGDPSNFAFLALLLDDGAPAWKDAARNIDYGTQKLHHLILAFGGDEFFACCGYNAGEKHVRAALGRASGSNRDERERAADYVTTGHDYARDVLSMRTRFKGLIDAEHRVNGATKENT